MKKFFLLIAVICVTLHSCSQPSPSQDKELEVGVVTPTRSGVSQTYVGKVGARAAIFILRWSVNGNVEGQYSHPDDGGTMIYQLKGINTADGEMQLTEYTKGKQSAVVTLRKSVANGLILWNGPMHNTDGRVLPVTMTRRVD